MPDANAGLQSKRVELGEWLRFIRADSHVLSEDARALFQQAANQPDAAAPARAAARRLAAGGERRPWLRWTNKPQQQTARIQFLAGHPGQVKACAFAPDGRRIVSGGADGLLRLWETESGQELAVLTGHTGGILAIAFSPDGRIFVSASQDHALRIWTSGGSFLKQLVGHRFDVTACAISPDGERLASVSKDGTLRIWNVAAGSELRSLGEGLSDIEIGSGSAGRQFRYLTACAFSPDGRRVLTGNGGGRIVCWDWDAGRELFCKQAHKGAVALCAFSADGERFTSASAADGLKVWDGDDAFDAVSFASPSADYRFGHEEVVAVTLGRRMAAYGCRDGSLYVASLDQGSGPRRIGKHDGAVLACAFSAADQLLVTASDDATLGVWVVAAAAEQPEDALPSPGWRLAPDRARLEPFPASEASQIHHPFDIIKSIDPLPGGMVFAARHYQWLILGEAASQQILGVLAHEQSVDDYAVSLDLRWIATVSAGAVRLWAGATMALRDTIAQNGRTRVCALSPAGDLLAWGNDDGSLGLWLTERREHRCLQGRHELYVTMCRFSPDGKRLASAAGGTLKLWDAGTGDEIATLAGHGWDITAIAFSPDGRLIASASRDQTARIWDACTGKGIHVLRGHRHMVSECAFSPDGQWLGTVSYDGRLMIWELQGGIPLCGFRIGGLLKVLDWRAGDNSLGVSSATGKRVQLELVNAGFGPAIMTAWRAVALGEKGLFACPSCRNRCSVPLDSLGSETTCERCGKRLRLNRFAIVIEPGWLDGLTSASHRRVGNVRIGRNDPCPCGSGKKYAKCHGAPK